MKDQFDERHAEIMDWLTLEWPYQQSKFREMGESEPARTPEVGLGHAQNYRHQGVNVYGLNEVRGRQRLAKAIATEIAVLVYAMEKYGDLPEPGHSSTEDVIEWSR